MEIPELKAMIKSRVDSINTRNAADEAARRMEKETR